MGRTIEIDHFSVSRGTFELQDISLRVEAGEIFAVLGQTGAGKTVLLESITGLFPGSAGMVRIGGRPVMSIPARERGIGFVYQDYQLFPHMTVARNISYGPRTCHYSKAAARKRTEELLRAFGIEKIRDQYPDTLSGGERQRTAFARALALEPEVLLLDEPFSALDEITKEKLYRELESLHERLAVTILFVTHDRSEARRLADRVGVIREGRLVSVEANTEKAV